ERRTLPSRTAPTFNLCATVAMSGCSPWNEKDEVRAATCSSLIRESELSSSSVSPSEKYSCSLSPLRFTNGSTAIECGGGLNARGGAGLVIQGFWTNTYAATAARATMTPSHADFKRKDFPEVAAAGPRVRMGDGEDSPDSSCCMRLRNSESHFPAWQGVALTLTEV